MKWQDERKDPICRSYINKDDVYSVLSTVEKYAFVAFSIMELPEWRIKYH